MTSFPLSFPFTEAKFTGVVHAQADPKWKNRCQLSRAKPQLGREAGTLSAVRSRGHGQVASGCLWSGSETPPSCPQAPGSSWPHTVSGKH